MTAATDDEDEGVEEGESVSSERLLFRDAGRTPLLGAEEERTLAIRIERIELGIWRGALRRDRARALRVAAEALAAPRPSDVGASGGPRPEVPRRPSARSLRTVDLDRRALAAVAADASLCPPAEAAAWVAARGRFVSANMRYAIAVARGFPHYWSAARPDVVSEAYVGLLRALGRFDPRRGYKFSTYCTWWVKHTIRRWVQDHGRTIRVPSHLQSTKRRASIDTSTWAGSNQHVRLGAFDASLDAPARVGEDGGVTLLGDVIPCGGPTPEEAAVESSTVSVLRRVVEELAPRERAIVRGRFFEDLTLEELGERFGISRERVRQIQAKVLRELKKRAESLGIG